MEGERGRERVENKEIINKDLWFATIQREGVIYRHHIRVHYYRLQLEHIESTYGLEKEKNRKTKKEKIEKRKKEKNGKKEKEKKEKKRKKKRAADRRAGFGRFRFVQRQGFPPQMRSCGIWI